MPGNRWSGLGYAEQGARMKDRLLAVSVFAAIAALVVVSAPLASWNTSDLGAQAVPTFVPREFEYLPLAMKECDAVPTYTPTPTSTSVSLPDLIISDVSMDAGPIPAWTTVEISAAVFNDSTEGCTDYFWSDLYVYTDTMGPPGPSERGVDWRWRGPLAAGSGATLTFDHVFTISGTHYIYARADASGFVEESAEENNVGGPLTVTVHYFANTPTPTSTPTEEPTCGAISGTVWAFVGGQIVVPSDAAEVRLWPHGTLVATVESDDSGAYSFDCVWPAAGYMVDGSVELDGTPYYGYESGIIVLSGEETSPVDLVLYPM
jgi:hypothetical protein